MCDPNRQEALEHLVRIQNRIDPTGKFRDDLRAALGAEFGADVTQHVDWTAGVHDPGSHAVLGHISIAVELACRALGLDVKKGSFEAFCRSTGLAARAATSLERLRTAIFGCVVQRPITDLSPQANRKTIFPA
jgi:hypothetical protein